MAAAVQAQNPAKGDIRYNRDIRPVLSENCFKCHGPDARARQAGLRFDDANAVGKPLPSGEIAIVPGDLERSAMIARITSQDASVRMPPRDSGKSLSSEEIDSIVRWVGEGAKYEPHWSFVVPARPAPPETQNEDWAQNEIDRFILARLEDAGIQPSPEADKVTLLRRVHLDLVGLPPAPNAVTRFLNDDSPGAYEKVVDDLFRSPHFGERWARHWLDAARYADSNGYSVDSERSIWPYRDWVVEAFNRGMPWDRFVTEQMAGDLLPGSTRD